MASPPCRHCERSEAIQGGEHVTGLLRCARNDGLSSPAEEQVSPRFADHSPEFFVHVIL